MTLQDQMLTFFKALADANRLKIVGLLAGQDLTVEQLGELLDLGASTVSHHLSRLSEAGLVSARAESYYNIYHLETRQLETMAKQLLSAETLPAIASDVDLDAYDRKVVSGYLTPEGRLKTIPSQRKKLEAVLGYVVGSFEPGVRYSEKEVNEILSRYHADTATLRRELIGFGLLERAGGGGEYWRPEEEAAP
jgi:biotin operon repressor